MPNYADNVLEIKGPKKEIQKVKDKLRIKTVDGDNISPAFMNTFFPRPKTEDKNWYEWNIKHWGVKWDVDAQIEVYEDEELRFYFQSAWSGPINFVGALAENFPNVCIFLHTDSVESNFSHMMLVKGKYTIRERYDEGITTNDWPESKYIDMSIFDEDVTVTFFPVEDKND